MYSQRTFYSFTWFIIAYIFFVTILLTILYLTRLKVPEYEWGICPFNTPLYPKHEVYSS